MIFLWQETQEITPYDSLECLEMKAAIEASYIGKPNFFAPLISLTARLLAL